MGLDYAIDALYQTGWHETADAELRRHPDGRAYPAAEAVEREFETYGFVLSIRHVQLFDCYRAEWTARGGPTVGAVVGATPDEASVYALAQLRRSHLGTAAI